MKKSKIMIIILVVLLIFIGIFAYFEFFNQNSNQNNVKVGNATFSLPNGYVEGSLNSEGNVNVTNGYNSIFIANHDGGDMERYVNSNKEFVKSQNLVPIISNFTVDNISVVKLTLENNTQYYHYWFVNKNTTYDIYTWDGNNKMDSIASDLIRSMN